MCLAEENNFERGIGGRKRRKDGIMAQGYGLACEWPGERGREGVSERRGSIVARAAASAAMMLQFQVKRSYPARLLPVFSQDVCATFMVLYHLHRVLAAVHGHPARHPSLGEDVAFALSSSLWTFPRFFLPSLVVAIPHSSLHLPSEFGRTDGWTMTRLSEQQLNLLPFFGSLNECYGSALAVL